MFVVALDVSMKKSYAVIYESNTCLWEGIVAHTRTGFDILLNEIQNLPQTPEVVFEATGVYSQPVESLCQKNDLPYALLNPLQAKK